jgi:hypothetical protein
MFQPCVPRCSAVLCPNEPATIPFHADPLAHNFTGEDQVFKDGVVYSCQGAASGTLLLIFRTAFLSWLRQNSPLGHVDHMLPTALFLQFTY